MRILLKLTVLALSLTGLGVATGLTATAAAYLYVAPELPPIASLRDIQLQVPLRVYSRDGRLMAEFGEKRRTPVKYTEIPEFMIQAFTAAEDDRFFQHPGVDYQGLLRAAAGVLLTGEKRQGGSTITMQVARNFFLSNEKTYVRKIREIFLSLRIERDLSKADILELYLNKILLGHRAYGVGAAAEVYYGKTVNELSLAEIATIAGLPKAPSTDNPISNPDKARGRRAYVLRRMLELGHISQTQFDQALAEPIETQLHGPTVELNAPYVAEMVRAEMVARFGTVDAYSNGYIVTTTLDSRLQNAAVAAMQTALLGYDERHGYRGPLAQLPAPVAEDIDVWREALRDFPKVAGLQPAIVLDSGETARLYIEGLGMAELNVGSVAWARRFVDDHRVDEKVPAKPSDVIAPGDIVYVRRVDSGWKLAQVPQVQGAFVSVAPGDGAITALTGGFDYYSSKFNRAVQAKRQPGSAFKPFIFSAALEHGFTPATVVNDAPVVFEDAALEDTWRPQNYSQRFYGPTRLREALVRSRNLVSIRVLREIGIVDAIKYLTHFGFDEQRLPRDLSLALGSIALSPLELATAYSVFANGGYRVEPYFIERIADAAGKELFVADPQIVCADCQVLETVADWPLADPDADACIQTRPVILAEQLAPRVLDEQNAWIVVDMMRDVVQRGTAQRAKVLERQDLAGKTGTTNDYRDAWFSGFNNQLVATVWVGFDQERPLGASEVGGTAALPAWIDFMRVALAGTDEAIPVAPPGLVRVRISPESGLLARSDNQDAIFEVFRVGHIPEQEREAPIDFFDPDNEEDQEEQPLF